MERDLGSSTSNDKHEIDKAASPAKNPHNVPHPIYERADACYKFLEQIYFYLLDSINSDKSRDALRKFYKWCKLLDVWVENGRNLDALLDAPRTPLRNFIESRLGALGQCSWLGMELFPSLLSTRLSPNRKLLATVLKIAKAYGTDAKPKAEEACSTDGTDAGLKASEASSTDAEPKPFQDCFDTGFTAIEYILSELKRVSNRLILFRESEYGFKLRVLLFRENRNISGLNPAVIQHIMVQYPHLKPTFRHSWGVSCSKTKKKYFEPDEAAIEKPRAPSDEPAGLFKALKDAVLFTHYKMLCIMADKKLRLEESKCPEIASWTLPAVETPPPPSAKQECPVCKEPCSKDSVDLPNDMCHFMHTAKPYICLYEHCQRGGLVCFETAEEWKGHMKTDHTSIWTCHLYKNVHWLCPDCDRVSPVEFESIELMAADLAHHLHQHHGEKDDEETLKRARGYGIECNRDMNSCPICGTCYPASEQATTDADNEQALTDTDSGEWSTDTDSDDESTDTESVCLDEPNEQVHDCIASHLLQLSRKFTYPVLNMGDSSSQSDAGPSSPASHQSHRQPPSPSNPVTNFFLLMARQVKHGNLRLTDHPNMEAFLGRILAESGP